MKSELLELEKKALEAWERYTCVMMFNTAGLDLNERALLNIRAKEAEIEMIEAQQELREARES